jgi:hypothetical protein
MLLWLFFVWIYGALLWAIIGTVRESEAIDGKFIWGAIGSLFVASFVIAAFPGEKIYRLVHPVYLIFSWVAFLASLRIVVRYHSASDFGSEPSARRTLFETACFYFLFLLLSTAGAALAASIVVLAALGLVGFVFPGLGATTLSAVLYLPFYPLQVIAGAFLGYLAALLFRTRAALWVWIPPLALLTICFVLYPAPSVFHSRWAAASSYYFGTCETHDCFARTVAVAPLFSSIAFAVSGLLFLRRGQAERGNASSLPKRG